MESDSVFREGLFRDKVILVSGAGTGLGKGIAQQFAQLGASLVICGRNAERLEAAAEEIRAMGGRVLVRAMTIRDPDAVASLMDEAWREFGRIDILVNNAGGQFASPALEIKPKGWLAVIDTNLNGTWYMMQAAAQRWQRHQQPGNIINIVTVVWRGLPHVAHTCAARAGVIFLSKTVAVEWAPHNIRVNCLAAGTIVTEGFKHYSQEGQASFHQANPMKHAGDVSDISEGVMYLASEASKYITGEVVNIDGGQQIWGDPWFGGRPRYFELDYEASRRIES